MAKVSNYYLGQGWTNFLARNHIHKLILNAGPPVVISKKIITFNQCPKFFVPKTHFQSVSKIFCSSVVQKKGYHFLFDV